MSEIQIENGGFILHFPSNARFDQVLSGNFDGLNQNPSETKNGISSASVLGQKITINTAFLKFSRTVPSDKSTTEVGLTIKGSEIHSSTSGVYFQVYVGNNTDLVTKNGWVEARTVKFKGNKIEQIVSLEKNPTPSENPIWTKL